MKLTRNAVGMLVNRYRSVLKKCRMRNVLGSLALAGAITFGAGAAFGVEGPSVTMDSVVTGTTTITATNGNVTLKGGVDNATGTIKAEGTPGNILSINDQNVAQAINQGSGKLDLNAAGNIQSGALTVNSATAGKDITTMGAIQGPSITAGGNITAFDASAAEGSQAFDINGGAITSGGTIKSGDIMTQGDLTAVRVETYANTDGTVGSGRGGIEVNGALHLTGTGDNHSEIGRRLDIKNTEGSENTFGDVTTHACISILGDTKHLSTATGGDLIIVGGQYTQGWGMQAKIDYIENTTNSLSVRGWGPVETTLDLANFNEGYGHILADSHWDYGTTIVAVQNIAEDKKTKNNGVIKSHGSIIVGQNSMVGVGQGTTVDSLRNTLAAKGVSSLQESGVKAMLALNQPVQLNWGVKYLVGASGWENRPSKIHIDGDHYNIQFDWNNRTGSPRGELWNLQKSIDAPDFFQGNNTLLVINGDNPDTHYTPNANAKAANTAVGAISINHDSAPSAAEATKGTAKVEANATLMITNPKLGDTYVILGDGFDQENGIDIDPTSWTGDNLITDNPLANLKMEKGQIKTSLNSSSNVLPGLDGELVSVVDSAALAGQLGTSANAFDSGARGTQFLSRAVAMAAKAPYGPDDATSAVTTIESAARMVVIGAVPQMAYAANQAAGAAITQRTSMADPSGTISAIDAQGNTTWLDNTGFAMWIMPLYQSTNGFGMEAGNFDYDFSGALGGVAIGADYTFENAIRAGITFNIGGGYAKGSGDLNETNNNMNFWGLGAYVGGNWNGVGLTADLAYTSTFNELKQDLPDQMGWDELKSDLNAWALSVGLRAEYKINLDALDIIPHVSARYTNLNVDSYDIKYHGTVIDGDSMNQNIWTFPMGVTFTKNIQLDNGWRVKPLLDLLVTPAAGDIKAKSKIHFTGTDRTAELETKMMDYFTYGGTAGIEFGNENFSIGVNYSGQFGAESSAHGVFGFLRYEF